MFTWETGLDIDERIEKNIKNMVALGKGDLAYDRDLGVSTTYKDKMIGAYNADILTEITEMCNEREPRAVTEVELDDNGELKVVWEDAEA